MANPGDDTKVTGKRSRVEPDEFIPDSPPAKKTRVPVDFPGGPELVRLDSVASSDSVNSVCLLPEVNTEHVADLLCMFDVPDSVADPEIDSVVRSLQEEIAVGDAGDPSAEIKSGNELCYLLEASDDELGLPPRKSPPESYAGGEIRVYDLSELGIGGADSEYYGDACDYEGGACDFGALDRLFDDQESEGSNSKLTWQPERVSAL